MVLKRIVVTGAAGMVGRHLLAALGDAGFDAVPSSRRRSGSTPTADPWVEWDLGDWKTPKELDAMFPNIDAVVHAGAAVPSGNRLIDDKTMLGVNVQSCLCLGEWALERNIPIVFISGAIVYAEPETSGIREDAPRSGERFGGFYGASKFQAECTFESLAERGLSVAILRPSSIYGDGLPEDKMVIQFLAAAAENKAIELTPPIDDRIDLVHASDVARAAILALEKEAWEIFNIALGEPVTVEEIAQSCIRVVGAGSVVVSREPAKRKATTRFGLDITRARTTLGYRPQVMLDDGLRQMTQNTATMP